jgi:hypothetical protein
MDNFLYCGLEARHPSWRAAALRLFALMQRRNLHRFLIKRHTTS